MSTNHFRLNDSCIPGLPTGSSIIFHQFQPHLAKFRGRQLPQIQPMCLSSGHRSQNTLQGRGLHFDILILTCVVLQKCLGLTTLFDYVLFVWNIDRT